MGLAGTGAAAGRAVAGTGVAAGDGLIGLTFAEAAGAAAAAGFGGALDLAGAALADAGLAGAGLDANTGAAVLARTGGLLGLLLRSAVFFAAFTGFFAGI